jgi:hypothetical protein
MQRLFLLGGCLRETNRRAKSSSEGIDCSLGTTNSSTAKEPTGKLFVVTGVLTGIGPPHTSPAPTDFAGTDRKCRMKDFFQSLAQNFPGFLLRAFIFLAPLSHNLELA